MNFVSPANSSARLRMISSLPAKCSLMFEFCSSLGFDTALECIHLNGKRLPCELRISRACGTNVPCARYPEKTPHAVLLRATIALHLSLLHCICACHLVILPNVCNNRFRT